MISSTQRARPAKARKNRPAAFPASAHKTSADRVLPRGLLGRLWADCTSHVVRLAGTIKRALRRTQRRRKLQLLEVQQLGDKRFVAIVRVGRQKFLIGGAASSVGLLAELHSHKSTVRSPQPVGRERA